MRAIQENEMAEPRPQRATERAVGRAAVPGVTKSTMHTDPSTPGCPAWRASELPLPQPEDRLEVICAPLARAATWTCRPQAVSAASPSQAESLAHSPDSSASGCTPGQVPPTSPLLRPWRRPPHRSAGYPRPTRGELTRPGVFLRSFSCSPRRLSRGVQPGSLHLPVRSPPFFTSPTSPDLVVEGGEARDEGGAEAGGEMQSLEIRARSGKGRTGQRTPWAGRARPPGSKPVQGRDLGRGPGGESGRKTSTLGAAGRQPAALGPGRGRPRGPGQSGFRVELRSRGRCAWEAVQGAPSEPHLATPPIYSILDSQRRQQEEEVGRKR